MGDKNPIRTLGDYSKPSHEGYRNTIELLVGNNVVSLRSDTIRTVKLRNDILMFQQHQGESLSEAWTHRIEHTLKQIVDYPAGGRLRKLSAEKAWATIKELAQYEDEGWNDLVAPGKGSLDYKNPDIEQLLRVMEWKLKEEIRMETNIVKKIEKIISYPDTEDLEPLNEYPQSTSQVFPSFEEYASPVTYPEEVEETIGTPIEVEPLNETQQEDLGLNTCNHDIPLSSRKVPSFDKPEPQPKPLANCPTLDVSLGDERGPQPPIKPHSPDSFRMKVVEPLTIHTPPSPHVASFHPKNMYCYYRPCIDDPKKHYGFKPGLLGHIGSLGIDFSKVEMIEDDWELQSKEVSFLGR
ncbi:hypothetical protein Tco_0280357 [Tanacetum coccineum]